MKKIAVICPAFGSVLRGIETLVYDVFTRLAETKKYEITIFGSQNIKFNNPLIKTVKIPLLNYSNFFCKLYSKITKKLNFAANEPYDFSFLIYAIKLLPVLFNKKYDVIFNQGGLFTGKICQIYRFFYNTPFIHSGHAGINNLEYKLSLQKPDYYIASSPAAQKWIIQMNNKINPIVIPNGIDNNVFYPFKSNIKNLNLQKPVFLFVGNLSIQKQPLKILQAYLKIKKGSLLFIGDGPEKNNILKLVEKEKLTEKQFKLINKVEYNMLPEYFNYSDYFIMPSLGEAFGIVYCMALAVNIPIIYQKNDIQDWIINDAGLAIDSSNLNNIVEAMLNITQLDFKDKPLIQSKKFLWNNIIKKYDNLLKK